MSPPRTPTVIRGRSSIFECIARGSCRSSGEGEKSGAARAVIPAMNATEAKVEKMFISVAVLTVAETKRTNKLRQQPRPVGRRGHPGQRGDQLVQTWTGSQANPHFDIFEGLPENPGA